MDRSRHNPAKKPAAAVHTRGLRSSLVDDLCSIAEQIVHAGDETTTPLAEELLRKLTLAIGVRFHWQEQVEVLHARHPGFLSALDAFCPQLTPRERQICVLIRLEMDTWAMAEFIGTGRKNIDNRRNSIRRKLGISPTVSLRSFLETL